MNVDTPELHNTELHTRGSISRGQGPPSRWAARQLYHIHALVFYGNDPGPDTNCLFDYNRSDGCPELRPACATGDVWSNSGDPYYGYIQANGFNFIDFGLGFTARC